MKCGSSSPGWITNSNDLNSATEDKPRWMKNTSIEPQWWWRWRQKCVRENDSAETSFKLEEPNFSSKRNPKMYRTDTADVDKNVHALSYDLQKSQKPSPSPQDIRNAWRRLRNEKCLNFKTNTLRCLCNKFPYENSMRAVALSILVSSSSWGKKFSSLWSLD